MSDMTLDQLEGFLRAAGRNVDEVTAPVVRATAEKVAETQRQHVAVDTGRTKKSIRATGPKGQPFTKKTTEAEIGPTWFVGRYIELGTSTQAPRVFVGDSLDPHLAAHEKATADAAADALFDRVLR